MVAVDFLKKCVALQNIIAVLLLVLMFSSSCEPRFDPWDYTMYSFISREANYMWVDNLKRESRVDVYDNKEYRSHKHTQLKELDTICVENYSLGFSTCNVDIPDITAKFPQFQNILSSPDYNSLRQSPYMFLQYMGRDNEKMASEPDFDLEQRLQLFFAKRSAAAKEQVQRQTRANLVFVDYRTTPVSDLNITCSEEFDGIPAGESLNDLFLIDCYPERYNFIITVNKQVIGNKIQDISVSQYLSYEPLAPAAMYFRLTEGVTIKEPITARFTVTLKLDNERTISAVTPMIHLIPKRVAELDE